ncbi:hypothetical protein, partial [Methanosarcina mazei]|uniref:hypothetical protein n=1 Tax=Methanosarcina mazei TaxID=2209 RepID=UPI001F2BF722
IFKVKNEEARVHFIPTLKDGVFVTLCAPLVIKDLSRLIRIGISKIKRKDPNFPGDMRIKFTRVFRSFLS